MPVVVKSRPEILHAIVGTAGHVDHGKTSLVRLLTGCDTDRLPEEKARGMSIDLGFAPCLLKGDEGRRVVGIVDVPGHRDFIRNMVAGAASIDVLLLVIAADDGVMPQTLEHMKIVRLLRQPHVLVALTKVDMVSPERVQEAQGEIAAFLARAGFPQAPIIPVSNKTGEGIGDIRDTIDDLVARVHQRGRDTRAFRLNVERVFSVKGYGTVVTGIPVSGEIHVGDKIELLPAARPLAVRTVQMYKHESEVALASCCCAINVREIDADLVTRGMTIAAPGIYHPTTELIVALENALDGPAAAPFPRRFEARLHAGTAAVDASLKLLHLTELDPGAQGLAHIVLAEPLTLAAGDRFIIRSLSPADTLGGGVILTARAQRLRRHADVIERLTAAWQAAQQGDYLAGELLAAAAPLVPAAEAHRLTQHTGPAAAAHIAAALARGLLVDLTGGHYLVRARLNEVAQVLARTLERYHKANPLAWGMTSLHTCEMLGLAPRCFDSLATLLQPLGQITVRHGRLGLAAFRPDIPERLAKLHDRVVQAITAAGVNAPARGNLIRDLAITEEDMKTLEKLLTGAGEIVVLDGNFMCRPTFVACRETLLRLFQKTATVELAVYKEALATNRKMAVALLDAFDAEGLTRRVANARVLARKPASHKEIP